MKKSCILAFVALFAINALSYAQQFTVNVKMADMPEGAMVNVCNEMMRNQVYASGVVKNGEVSLQGNIDNPVMVYLQINDKAAYGENEYERKRFVSFLLSDTIISITAASFSDIPYTYEMGHSPVEMEMNAKVEGGILQQHYEQWRTESYPYRFSEWQTSNEIWALTYGPGSYNRTPQQKEEVKIKTDSLKTVLAEKSSALNKFNDDFLAAHPTYTQALRIVESKLAKSFCYSADEIDALVDKVKGNEDIAGYQALIKNAENAKRFLKNSDITDFKVESPDGTSSTFKEVFNGIIKDKPYKAVLVDFWASWCGPCRASIPSVKQLYNATKDKLAIISISVDRKEDDWKTAMEQEQMPWLQLRSLPSESKILTDSYNLLGIPSIFIISPEGKIIFFTHDPDEAHLWLHKL